MRLICPNCDAEYEVDASVIPDGGRDVQCSSCGHAWFQLPPEVEAAEAAEAEIFEPPSLAAAPVVSAPPAGPAKPAPRPIDADVLNVLREEAEREANQRRHEAPPEPIETQDELALPPAAPVPRVAAPVAALPPAEAEPEAGAAPAGDPGAGRAKGRDLLPDIEEINSTLRPSGISREGEPMPAVDVGRGTAADGRGFRLGFGLMLLLAAILVGVYSYAPRLSQQLPALAPALDAFVAAVDAGRLWLDGVMKAAIGAINGTDNRG